MSHLKKTLFPQALCLLFYLPNKFHCWKTDNVVDKTQEWESHEMISYSAILQSVPITRKDEESAGTFGGHVSPLSSLAQ